MGQILSSPFEAKITEIYVFVRVTDLFQFPWDCKSSVAWEALNPMHTGASGYPSCCPPQVRQNLSLSIGNLTTSFKE